MLTAVWLKVNMDNNKELSQKGYVVIKNSHWNMPISMHNYCFRRMLLHNSKQVTVKKQKNPKSFIYFFINLFSLNLKHIYIIFNLDQTYIFPMCDTIKTVA